MSPQERILLPADPAADDRLVATRFRELYAELEATRRELAAARGELRRLAAPRAKAPALRAAEAARPSAPARP